LTDCDMKTTGNIKGYEGNSLAATVKETVVFLTREEAKNYELA